jgi:hypothetical protein
MNRSLPDDGLFTPPNKAHSVDKIVRNYVYVRLVATDPDPGCGLAAISVYGDCLTSA